ncbi:HlyD family secretion protein [Novosphingopyxis iocasae]|uniref:HlyD family secretion protein n=1 Tax=Novosphingopyxis iocasae TaxID=2762729 RepID=UPI001650F94E|nr:HlyD family efflux transporter periplasmic adaptor subunit [Novosphingopyxis iocasae]
MPLFRSEVLDHRKESLHGDVNMVLPISWQMIGGLFFVALIAAILFLSLAGYSRIEVVTGTIEPRGGVAKILPTRPGILTNLAVQEGQVVSKGATLGLVRSEDRLANGGIGTQQVLNSLNQQERGLSLQQGQIDASAQAVQAQQLARITGLQAATAGLAEQIEVQRSLVDTARNELELARKIGERGFVSRRDIQQREEVYLGRKQRLTELRQSLSAQQSAISEARAAIRQSQADAGSQIAALTGQREQIEQQRTSAEVASAIALTAPVDGVVSALTGREGQAVGPQAAVMSIVPESSRLQAELIVPSSAIGFVRVGQQVRISLDAFPYQRFGTLPATITSIASTPIAFPTSEGGTIPGYLVIARLDESHVRAYGNEESLLAGMTLTARIVTERQSLIEWLFEPLFAVGRR